jgi:lipopolysaccharide transport system permease protein
MMASNTLSSDVIRKPRTVRVLRAPSFSPLGLLGNILSLVQYRDLLITLTIHRIRVRYKQSVLGIAWAILQPVSLMLIYTLIFSFIAKISTDGVPYAIFAFAALLPWTYFSTSLGNATNSLVGHSELVTKVYFPREILPLSYVIAALCDFLIASTVMVALLVYYRVTLTVYAFYTIPIVLVLTLFIVAMVLILSATQVRFRDIGVAVPLLMQLWMFATPVVYPLSAVPARFQSLYVLNPMVGTVENFRRVVLQSAPPDFYTLYVSAAVTIVLLIVSYIYFKHIEATVADLV